MRGRIDTAFGETKSCTNQPRSYAGASNLRENSAVAIFTGGFDKPYVVGLTTALAAEGLSLDVIGSDDLDVPEINATPRLQFFNLQRSRPANVSFRCRLLRVLAFYACLLRYTISAKPAIFHILWNNKWQFFDRTLLMLYYRFLGKKIILTAHNVNAGRRDGNDSVFNRISLRLQYRLADHIFVHTETMKSELINGFRVRELAVTVIPFGINNTVPRTDLAPGEARRRLGLGQGERVILFYGNIRPYKGLDHLVTAFQRVAESNHAYRLIIAGDSKKQSAQYLFDIQEAIKRHPSCRQITQEILYIPDSQTELYFKAADVTVLPYTHVYQSGVLLLAYSFGLPVIAADVGSFREDIVEGRTGFLFKACDPIDLARVIPMYFESTLYRDLDRRRQDIRQYANRRYSWNTVSQMTLSVYKALLSE